MSFDASVFISHFFAMLKPRQIFNNLLNFSWRSHNIIEPTVKRKKMITIFWITILLIAVTMGLSLYRGVAGPGVFNRVAAVNIIGTKTIALLVVMGYYFERPYFFDIALLYAMINFIGTLVFAKYLERGELWS